MIGRTWGDNAFGAAGELTKYGKSATTGNTITIAAGNNNLSYTGTLGYKTVYGGYTTGSETVSNNKVTLESAGSTGYIYGGYSANGNVTENAVEIKGGNVSHPVYGGLSANGNATGNTAEIKGGTVTGYVYGGSSSSGNATGNTVGIKGGTVSGVYGGRSSSGNATGNTVNYDGGSVSGTIYGGYSGVQDKNVITGNTLNIGTIKLTTGNIANFETINFNSSLTQATTTSNAALILTGTDNTDLSGLKNLTYNTNGLGDGTYYLIRKNNGQITGYQDRIRQTDQTYTITSANNYKINGESTYVTNDKKNLLLGYGVIDKWWYDNSFDNSEINAASGNTITIAAGTAYMGNRSIYGGYAASGVTNNNTINFESGIGVGLISGGNRSSDITGNILNIGTTKLIAGNIANFETINIKPDLTSATTTANAALTLTGNEDTDLSGVKNLTYNANGLNDGQYYLIHKNNGQINVNASLLTGEQTDQTYTITSSTNYKINTKEGVALSTDKKDLSYIKGSQLNQSWTDDVFDAGELTKYGKSATTGNTVLIAVGAKDDLSSKRVYGGYTSGSETVSNNKVVTLAGNGGTVSYVYGGSSTSGNATGNTVNFSGGKVTGTIFGGNQSGDISGNVLNLKSTKLTAGNIENFETINITPDLASATTASNAVLTLTGSGNTDLSRTKAINVNTSGLNDGQYYLIHKNNGQMTVNASLLTGGQKDRTYTITSAANYKINVKEGLTLSTDKKDLSYIKGSQLNQSWTDNNFDQSELSLGQSGNSIIIESGNANENYGGKSIFGGNVTGAQSIINNTISARNGKNLGTILGGRSQNGAISGNQITVTGSELTSAIGGQSQGSGTVSGNKVTITGGTVKNNFHGGWSESGTSQRNEVLLKGGQINFAYGGFSTKGDAKSNKITVEGGLSQGNLRGGYSSFGTVDGNTIEIKSGEIRNVAYGGNSTNGTTTNNTVSMTGGKTKAITGGHSGNKTSSGNKVTVTNGQVTENVIGGRSHTGPVQNNTVTLNSGSFNYLYGGLSVSGDVTGNTITVNGGTVTGNIRAGQSGSGKVTNNVINYNKGEIKGIIYGSQTNGQSSGNTLNIGNTGLKAGNLMNFEKLNFKASLINAVTSSSAALTLTQNGNTDLSKVKAINVNTNGLSDAQYYLIHKNNGQMTINASLLTGGQKDQTYTITSATNYKINAQEGLMLSTDKKDLSYIRVSQPNQSWSDNMFDANELTKFGKSATTGNTITIAVGNNDLSGKTVYGGYAGGSNVVQNNKIILQSGTNLGSIYGGYSNTGIVQSNTINITGGEVQIDVYGGYSNADVKNNTVNFSGGNVYFLEGGYSENGAAANNIVNMTGGQVKGNVYGGSSSYGTAQSNKLIISGGTVDYDALGGYSYSGNAIGNTVTYRGGTVSGTIYGGQSSTEGKDVVTGNILNIDAVKLRAGNIANFETINFRLGLTSATSTANAALTLTQNGNTDLSKVKEIGYNLTGLNLNANTYYLIHKSGSGTLTGLNNNITHTGYTITSGTQVSKKEGKISISTDKKDLVLTKGQQNQQIQRSMLTTASYTGQSSGNDITVDLTKGQEDLKGQNLSGGSGTDEDAVGNKLTITNGINLGQIIGGQSQSGDTRINEIVLQNKAQIQSDVIGGKTQTGQSGDNTIILKDQVQVSGQLIGSQKEQNENARPDNLNGNILKIENYTGSGVGNIKNFEEIDIKLSKTNKGTILKLKDGEDTDLQGTRIKVDPAESLQNALQNNGLEQIGGEIKLLKKESGQILGKAVLPQDQTLTKGQSLLYTIGYRQTGNSINAITKNIRATPGLSTLQTGQIGVLNFLNQGNDLSSEVLKGTQRKEDTQTPVFAFGSLKGLHKNTGTQSHRKANVHGASALAGVGINLQDLMIGVYFEGGIGQVEGKQHTTEAKGDSRYYGSGLLLKYDLPILQGLYIQGGIKGGKTDNDIRSNVMKDHGGKRGGYDRKQTYWAAHAGIGYRYALQDNLELDTELKYLWTHLKGANLNIGGDPIKLDGLTSHRIRAGSRLNYGLDAQNKVYAGISWEYEFAGDAKVRAYNVTLRGDEYKGHSGIIELGININPASNRNLVIEAGFEGYLGKNKGLGGGIEIKYSF